MTSKTKHDVVGMFQTFQKDVLDKKPSTKEMKADVRMMQFKVRPLQGDIYDLNFQNGDFIETLWSLGKLDEFFQHHVTQLNEDERSVFYSMFDRLYQQYQSKLNHINLKRDHYDEEKLAGGFEVEIFRERNKKAN